MNQIHVILLGGGVGKRMNSELPKQFLKIHGESILKRTVTQIVKWGMAKSIVLVLPENYILEAKPSSHSCVYLSTSPYNSPILMLFGLRAYVVIGK